MNWVHVDSSIEATPPKPTDQTRTTIDPIRQIYLADSVNVSAQAVNANFPCQPHSGFMQEPSRWSGALLFAAPILIQIPYSLLIMTFDYPAILHQNPTVILERFASAGLGLPLIWLSFALAILPLLLGIALLPSAFPGNRWLSTLTPIGIASALLQMLGLARWVFLVPFLAAQHHTSPQPDTIILAFELQHRLFGNLIGEHLGQLFLGVWTTAAALAFTPRCFLPSALSQTLHQSSTQSQASPSSSGPFGVASLASNY
jgi:hypothetical protein